MNSFLRKLAFAWRAAERDAIVVAVVAAKGSVPRGVGTRMLVSARDAAGTIGGGHLELIAIERARTMLFAAANSPQTEHFALGPSLGQCCGGAVTLVFARLDAATLAAWPASEPRFHLQLHGAGHVGRAIARALVPLDVRVDWIDEREDEFPSTCDEGSAASWPAHIRKVSVDAVEQEVGHAPAGGFFLVLTHRHDLDLKITEKVLRRGDFAFLGLIGSKTKRARFVNRFRERGVEPGPIARLTCPIGLAGVSGKEPEVIAAAVVAQLLLVSSEPFRSAADESAGALGCEVLC